MSSTPSESLLPILGALASALSPVETERAASLAQLQAWATVPGYYSSLVEIFANRQLELGPHGREIKLQAVVQFKNGVDKYWRRAAANAISADEKAVIRPRLLAMVDEPDSVLIKTVALCIAKIARLDYGVDWAALPTSLLESLQIGLSHSDPKQARLVLHRTLTYSHATIKSLASNRIPRGRLLMVQFTETLFPTIRQLHGETFDAAMSSIRSNSTSPSLNGAIQDIELALLAFKCLSKMLTYGFKEPSSNEAAKTFFISTRDMFSALLELRLNLLRTPSQVASSTSIYLTKHLISVGKLYRRLLSHDANAFLQMGISSSLIETYWTTVQGASESVNLITDSMEALYPERLVVQSLLLLQTLLGDWSSAAPIEVPGGFVRQFAELIVTKFLPLRQVDLEKWTEDPEEWMNEEEAERWEFELRPSAEHALQMLLSQYAESLGPSMSQLLQQVSAPQSMDGLLLKEGVYCAVGNSPSELESYINFGHWLDNTLASEAAGTDSNQRILRRRIAWLVGNWVGEDLSQDVRTKIYSILAHLLSRNDSTDTAIRLTAARSLAKCDTWDFNREAFVPFLPIAIEEIVSLLGEVELADSRMRLNQTLGVVIDRVGPHIMPYAARLSEILATLWSSTQENHFQTSILVTYTKLAEALENQAQALQVQLCPVIGLSVDPTRPSHVYLQEDALELWSSVLKRSTSLSPEMFQLLSTLVGLIAAATDVLPTCLKILESYLLLDAIAVMQICGPSLFAAFESILGDLKLQAVKVILHTINTAFRSSPIENWAAYLEESRTFVKLLAPISDSSTEALIVTKYLCTLSRIVLAGPDMFLQLIDAAATRLQTTSDAILAMLVTAWVEKLDNMSQGGQLKLTALALAHLVATNRPVVLERLADIVSVWTGVLAQTEETETGDAELYQVPDDYQSDIDADYTDTLETQRRQTLYKMDPVHTTKLSTFIGQKLGEAQAHAGGPEAFSSAWLARVDPIVVDELIRRLDGRLAG